MHCKQAEQLVLEIGVEAFRQRASSDLLDHIEACAACQATIEDLRFSQLLSGIPVAGPSEGFADRALQQAWKTKDSQKTSPSAGKSWMLAAAASLVLAIGVVFTVSEQSSSTRATSPAQVAEIAPRETRQVDLLMVSGQALTDAYITLQMDGHIALEGYPDMSTIRWSTAIAAGNNQLTLPVQLLGNQSGSIVIEIVSGDARKQMLLTVDPSPQSHQISMVI